ncbi:ABC transporter ATP-binding protein [Leptolyngbya sp. FACHB-711]|uniref:ABC transporter ATP-binding protein n=1 Tax=unclassified Leptolyngbya TaxID=2650499 RepID=UPI0016825465|nr:ABC transporter ATP-binding protein [Leptolyngbya sp. FACHB-711]MBD1853532.1 ABC transporter ATP-binding protein [Cyanobacteria bacterium FACHB-502]MBD2023741.1 ABC transporter ATP-binding protein [Leptolyngbya sp. FACHB-711]
MNWLSSKIELREISHVFQSHDRRPVNALEDISLQVSAGRFVSLIGPSGSGKTTLFNIIAGLQQPTAGQVLIDERDVTGKIGLVSYMMQKDLLLPWRTVLDNVVLGMELQGISISKARQLALPYLYQYGLGGFENHYPAELSGGMRQRAALLRTLLCHTELILLDEPFGALDAQTRAQMQEWLLQLWSDFGKTVLFVTHDVDEAVYLSDEVFVLTARPGTIKARLEISLDRPRSRQIVTDPSFIRLKETCLALLADEDIAGSILKLSRDVARKGKAQR